LSSLETKAVPYPFPTTPLLYIPIALCLMYYHNGQDLNAAAAAAQEPANVPSFDLFQSKTLLVRNATNS